jgi:hypothetical protein
MNAFSVQAYLTKAEFVRMSVRRCYTNPVILFFSVIGLAAIAFGLAQVLHLIPVWGSVYPTIFIGVYFAVAFPAFNAMLAAKNYRVGTLSSRQITYTFSDEGLHLSGEDIETTPLHWSGIIRKQRVGKYLLLFTDRVSAFILPIEGFSEQQLDFVASKVPAGHI